MTFSPAEAAERSERVAPRLREHLPPTPFELEAWEEEELRCLRAAAQRRFGDAGQWVFETTIAALLAGTP